MTTSGLEDLKRLINEAATRRTDLIAQISAGEGQLTRARLKLSLARWFIIRLFTRRAIPRLIVAVDQAKSSLDDKRLQLAGCSVEIDFGLDDVTSATYSKLIDSFKIASGCVSTWQIVTTAQIDRVAVRTIAGTSMKRRPVRFVLSRADIIDTPHQSLKFGDVAGSEIHIYPGFALYREPDGDFALVELSTVDLKLSTTRFVEDEGVPPDAETQGYTWKKANKDGSRDHRFNGNYQIPIAIYGELALSSRSGLNELYMLSHRGKAAALYSAFAAHKTALATLASKQQEAPQFNPESLHVEELDTSESKLLPPNDSDHSEISLQPRFTLDWIALVGLIGLVVSSGWWIDKHPDQLRASFARAFGKTAQVDQPFTKPSIVEKPQPVPPSPPVLSVIREAVVVQALSANVRSDAVVTSAVVATMHKGTKLLVFGRKGDWVQIGDTAPIGWMHKSLLGTLEVGASPASAFGLSH
jgi:hypothetical protein